MFYHSIFLLTGIVQTMVQQALFYVGAAEKTTLLPTTAMYFGVALNSILPFLGIAEAGRADTEKVHSPKARTRDKELMYGCILGLLEVLGSALSFVGVTYAGSGLYQVIYSSITIFIAIEARLLFGRILPLRAWCGILLTTSGLVLSTLGTMVHEAEIGNDQLFGIFITLCSTAVYSAIYTIGDYLVSGPTPISTQRLSTITGLVALFVGLIYLLFYTLPNWQTLFLDNVAAAGGSYSFIILGYSFLALASLGHNWSFYGLIGNVGSVGTGILQSLRAVSVFFTSAIFFCDQHETQCITSPKILATVLVISGLLVFISTKETSISKVADAPPEDVLLVVEEDTPSHIN